MLVAVAVVSVTVDHGRHGGPITPAAALASKSEKVAAGAVVAGATLEAPASGPELSASAPLPTAAGVTNNGRSAAPPSAAPTPNPSGRGAETPLLPFPPPQVPGSILPPELQPLAGLASPMSFFACQYLGLVPLAAALGGVLGSPVPLSDLLPYMRPVFDICLIPGVPAVDANCALDQQLDEGVGLPEIPVALGLSLGEIVQGVPVPRPEALAIEEFVQIERLLLGEPDAASAPPSDALAAALSCTKS